MPKYRALVVVDREKQQKRQVDLRTAELRKSRVSEHRMATLIAEELAEGLHQPGETDTLYCDVVDEECPDGLPNCRNCGDPAHAAACKAAGHCPRCGTLHGIGPASKLAEFGLEVVEVVVPRGKSLRQFKEDMAWDPKKRAFAKRG